MKKLLSILLTAIITLSVFSINAVAEGSQAESFFANLEKTRSLGIKYETDIGVASSPSLGMITTEEKAIKIYENSDGTYYSKLFLTGSVGSVLNYKLLMTDTEALAYLPNFRIKVDLEKIVDEEIDGSNSNYDIFGKTEINSFLFDPTFKVLEYVSSRKGTLESYLADDYENLTIETMKFSPYKVLEAAVEYKTVTLPQGTDIYSLSLDEIYAYLADANNMGLETTKKIIENTTYDIYIDDGKLYNITVNTFDKEGNPLTSSLKDSSFITVEYIYTDIADKEFNKPFLYMDFTYIVKIIIKLFFA